MLQLSTISSTPSDYLDISPSQSPSYSEVMTIPSSLTLLQVHYHWHILCQCYSVIIGGYHLGLFTQHLDLQFYVSGYGHAQNDLLLLSHVYSMSQILLVVYSLYTSLYYPSFESRLSSSNLFPELSLSFVFATH